MVYSRTNERVLTCRYHICRREHGAFTMDITGRTQVVCMMPNSFLRFITVPSGRRNTDRMAQNVCLAYAYLHMDSGLSLWNSAPMIPSASLVLVVIETYWQSS